MKMAAWSRTARRAVPRGESEVARTAYAVGDIHGCYALLVKLLPLLVEDAEALPPQEAPVFVFLGDYVDRGPETSQVLSSLLWVERHSPFETVFLAGNHERMMLDYLDDPEKARGWLKVGGAETMLSYGVVLPEELGSDADHAQLRDALLDRLPASHLAFLRRLRLHLETDDYLFVHAGIRPGVAIAAQEPDDLMWIRAEFLDNDRPAEKIVVHGHSWTSDEPVHKVNRIGIDTGAYETGVLTAVRLRAGQVRFLQARNETPAPAFALAERTTS